MSGRVTRVGIARWAGPGGSYRTVQRCFSTVMAWPVLFWVFFRQPVLEPTDSYVCAGDECVVTKAGKKTSGLDRFFSSLSGKPVPGLSFLAWSWMSLRGDAPLRYGWSTGAARGGESRTPKPSTQAHLATKAHSHQRPARSPPRQQESREDPPRPEARTATDSNHDSAATVGEKRHHPFE